MANNAVGEIVCPICGRTDEVRKNAKDKLYIYCEQFGIVQPARPAFQDWIRGRATMYGDGKQYNGGPEPKPEAADDWQPQEAEQQKAETQATPKAEKAAGPAKRDVMRAIVGIFTEEG